MYDKILSVMLSAATNASGVASAPQELGGIAGFMMQYGMWIVMLLGIVAMYFLMIRPNKKKEKEATERRSNIEIGDEITTIGGIVGRVVSLKEDNFVLETAGDRTRMRFKRWAIQDVNKLELETPGVGVDGKSKDDAKPEKNKKK